MVLGGFGCKLFQSFTGTRLAASPSLFSLSLHQIAV